jgi:glycosyltransferase involved in cell wall biosynthesis
MPAYNRPDTLARTLESLLSQTFHDFALVVVDDAPSPEVSAIVEIYAAVHTDTIYEANHVRLGMIANWRRAFERARTHYPGAEYFAWVSDHDTIFGIRAGSRCWSGRWTRTHASCSPTLR